MTSSAAAGAHTMASAPLSMILSRQFSSSLDLLYVSMLTGSRLSSTAWNANQSTKVWPYISSAASRATFLNSGCSFEIQERMISLCETSVSHKPQRKPRCPKTRGNSCDVENVNRGLIFFFFFARARANFLVFAETLQPMTPLISSRFERDTPISVRLTDSSSYHSYTTFTPINA